MRLLREEPQFRLLFLGQVLSLIGDRVAQIALPFAVLAAGGDVSDVGLVAAAQFVPFLIFSLVGGVIADRTDRKRVVIASDAVRLVVQAIAGVLVLGGDVAPLGLAPLAFVFGAADAFFAPSITGLLPQTLSSPAKLQAANSLRGLSMALGSIAGAPLGGLLIALTNPGGALLFDAATFAVSISFLVFLRPRRDVVDPDADPVVPGFLEGLRGGWREVRTRPWVWRFLLGLGTYHAIVLPAIFVLGPVLAEDEYAGATSWAIVVTGFGIGSALGNVLLLRWRPTRALRVAAFALIIASTQAAIIGSGLPILAIAGLEVLAGVAVTCFFSLWEVSLLEHIPGAAISRVSSYDYLVSVGTIPLGTAVAGPVSDAVGLRPTLFAMTAIGMLAGVLLLRERSVRTLPRVSA